MEKNYIAIDLKSFYASVECVERGLDPMTTNLVVADHSRGRSGTFLEHNLSGCFALPKELWDFRSCPLV